MRCRAKIDSSAGFTLIELSIVLVIIGLIVGGILTGRELIRTAGIRSTIAQIEKYNTAVNTFRVKYGALPGDLNASAASQFGFVARGSYAGEGDGNGVIEGVDSNAAGHNSGTIGAAGETVTFWVDLSTAKLIDGSFTTGSSTSTFGYMDLNTTVSFPAIMPPAKLGNGNYIFVWSGGWQAFSSTGNGQNYFGLAAMYSISSPGNYYSNPGLTVAQASAMDAKMDDGLPQSGRVLALYPYNGTVYWSAGGGGAGMGNVGDSAWPSGGPDTAATAASAVTCYDNGNVGGKTQKYSVGSVTGDNINCELAFQFQ